MLLFELAQFGFGVEAVNVGRPDVADRAAGEADIEVRVLPPPARDGVGACRGVLYAVRRGWPLVARQQRKYCQAALGKL